MSLVLIYLLIGVLLALGILGWFRSDRTRRLVVFALLVIGGAGVLFGLMVLARVLWFPDKPL